MVIAEIAVATGAAVFVMILLVGTIGAALVHVRTQDAARAGARIAARGEGTREVVQAAHESTPDARVSVNRDDELVRVTVTTRVRIFPGLPVMDVSKTATARSEDGQ
jgi:hypothetical protein